MNLIYSEPENKSSHEHNTLLALLLNNKGNCVMDRFGNTPVIWAAHTGNLQVVMTLVSQYSLPLNVQNFDGETALSMAVSSGKYDIVKYLIEHSANLNIANCRGESALHQAAALGFGEMARLIVEEGAFMDTEDECGETPLHFAVREERVDMVEYLLAVGAHPDHLNQDEESPEELAQMVGSPDMKNVFHMHKQQSSNALGLDANFGLLRSPLLLQKSTASSKSHLKPPLSAPASAGSSVSTSLDLSHSSNAVWQGENSGSFPKRLTPTSNLPGGYSMGRHLINV